MVGVISTSASPNQRSAPLARQPSRPRVPSRRIFWSSRPVRAIERVRPSSLRSSRPWESAAAQEYQAAMVDQPSDIGNLRPWSTTVWPASRRVAPAARAAVLELGVHREAGGQRVGGDRDPQVFGLGQDRRPGHHGQGQDRVVDAGGQGPFSAIANQSCRRGLQQAVAGV